MDTQNGTFDLTEFKVTALSGPSICLYREAMHLQCFPPTRYVRGGATGCAAYVDDSLPNILYRE